MNKDVKEIIIRNEKNLLLNFPQYRGSIKQYITKLSSIKYDKMLFDFIDRSFYNKIDQENAYNSKNYKSSRQLIYDLKDSLDFNDKLNLTEIQPGQYFTSLEISSLSGNYNIQVGMYYVYENNSVIIKSKMEDDNIFFDSSLPYDDKWIVSEKVLKYYMQSENNFNVQRKNFVYKPNAAIYNALIKNKKIDIHTFIYCSRQKKFKYEGIFRPYSLLDENKAFLLYKDGYEKYIPQELKLKI